MKEMYRASKKRKKWIIIAVAIAVVIFVLALGVWFVTSQGKKPEQIETKTTSSVTETVPVETETVVHLAMMGDMLAHDSVNAQAKTASGYDYTPYFTDIKPLYKEADVVFCNPETPVAGDTYGVTGYPAFNAPSAFARDLVKGAGCNVISLASNHQADKGQGGIDTSLAVWKSQEPYAYSGMNSSADGQNTVSYFTVEGVKFAFLAFMDFSNSSLPHSYSVNTYHNTALVQTLLAEAKANAQVVIVSAHWGVEDSSTVTADQKSAAQLFADNGASIVIGTGPHVEQAVSWLTASDGRTVPVWYSIGNMLSSQLGIDGLTSGVAQCDIRLKDGAITVDSLTFTPTFMSYEWSAADKAAGNLLARHNLKLQPLAQADAEIRSMFGSKYSAAERKVYLEKALDASTANVVVR